MSRIIIAKLPQQWMMTDRLRVRTSIVEEGTNYAVIKPALFYRGVAHCLDISFFSEARYAL